MDVFSYLTAAARAVLAAAIVLIVATFWLHLGWLPWLMAAGAGLGWAVFGGIGEAARNARFRKERWHPEPAADEDAGPAAGPTPGAPAGDSK